MAITVRRTTGPVVNRVSFWPQGVVVGTSSSGTIILDASSDDALLTPPIRQLNVHRM